MQQRAPPPLSRNIPAPPAPGSRPWLTLGSAPGHMAPISRAPTSVNFTPVAGDPGLLTGVRTLADRLAESAQRLASQPHVGMVAGGGASSRGGGSGGVAIAEAPSPASVPVPPHLIQQVAQQLQIMQRGPRTLGDPNLAGQLPPGGRGADSPPIPVPLMKKKRT